MICPIKKVVILGAGNVAWHLVQIFSSKDIHVIQVYNRSEKSAKEIATLASCGFTTNLNYLSDQADLYVICISDDYITDTIKAIDLKSGFFIHTAGSMSMDVFTDKFNDFGVLYPFMTLSKGIPVIQNRIPFCIEANSSENTIRLKEFAKNLSDEVYEVSESQRLILHLAGIITNNFINHLIGQSYRLIEQSGLSLEILRPILEETIVKTSKFDPDSIQTGPAVRNNQKIMNRHLQLLNDDMGLYQIYKHISENIIRVHSDKSLS